MSNYFPEPVARLPLVTFFGGMPQRHAGQRLEDLVIQQLQSTGDLREFSIPRNLAGQYTGEILFYNIPLGGIASEEDEGAA